MAGGSVKGFGGTSGERARDRLISRGQVLKGLGGGFVALGALPVLGSGRAVANLVDPGPETVWSQIFHLTGSVASTSEAHRDFDGGVTLDRSSATSASGVRLYLSYISGEDTLDETRVYISREGPMLAEYYFHELHVNEFDNSFVREYVEQGSATTQAVRSWCQLHVKPRKGLYSFHVFFDVEIPTNWEERTSSGTTTGSRVQGVFPVGIPDDRPLPGTTIHETVKTGGDVVFSTTTLRLNAYELLPRIPRVMRHFGWVKAAKLQERWLAGPARVLSEAELDPQKPAFLKAPKDTTTITMDWALGFPRAKRAYRKLVGGKLWETPNAKKEIVRMLKRNKVLDQPKNSFGNLGARVPLQDKDYITQVPVAYDDLTKLDDMVAALGRFNLRCVVAGRVQPVPNKPGRREVIINRVGVYVRDSYDFEGVQFLGFWNDSPPYANATNSGGEGVGVGLSNRTYSAYRSVHKKGGDFLVYSDLLPIAVNPPTRFII